MDAKQAADRTVKDIRRRTRKQHSAEEKIRIVLAGLRGEESIAALCRREGIAESLYYSWSKDRQANTGAVRELRRQMRDVKGLVADLTLENRLLKKSMIADGGDQE